MTYSTNEYSQYRIERATQTLHEVEKHIENQFGTQPLIECTMHVFML